MKTIETTTLKRSKTKTSYLYLPFTLSISTKISARSPTVTTIEIMTAVMLTRALRAGCQSGTIMGLADAGTQFFIEGKGMEDNSNSSFDALRTLRWAFLGLVLHGPYFLAGFSMLDKYFATKNGVVGWATVAKKTVTAQCLLFPPYLVLLFGSLGILEKEPDIPNKIKTRVPQAFMSGCVYWPVANSINFKLVPNHLRVPYLALSAGFWNSYLSYTNQKGRNSKKNS